MTTPQDHWANIEATLLEEGQVIKKAILVTEVRVLGIWNRAMHRVPDENGGFTVLNQGDVLVELPHGQVIPVSQAVIDTHFDVKEPPAPTEVKKEATTPTAQKSVSGITPVAKTTATS